MATNAFGWLNSLGLLIVVEDSSLTLDVLNASSVDVIDLDNVVGNIGVVLVVVVDDALNVLVVSVNLGDNGLVECGAVVVLSDESLQV